MSLRQRNPKQDEGRGDDIVELREELLGNIVHDGGGGGGGAMKAIRKKARQLLDGQNPKKKKQQQQKEREREKRSKNRTEEEEQKKQRSWPPNPPPYSFDASFTSAKGCCCPLPPIRANPRGAPKKPSNHNLLLRSLIERNDFYCKECNVHLR